MPELIDMKLPKQSKKDPLGAECAPESSSRDRWPYGLQIRFEKEQIEKMPNLKALVVGNNVNIMAMGCVTSVRTSERQDGSKDHSIEIQIEKVNLTAIKKPTEMNMKEYNEWRSQKK